MDYPFLLANLVFGSLAHKALFSINTFNVQQQTHDAKDESMKLLWVSGLCQEDEDKKGSKEVASSRPDASPEGEPPAKKKKLKESHPPPDRLPSSEYDDSDSDDEENENIPLHEEFHEELYGLPTPRKGVARGESGEIASTEMEQSPESIDDSDDDGDAMGKSAGRPSGDTTGTHKDQVPCMAHSVPPLLFLDVM